MLKRHYAKVLSVDPLGAFFGTPIGVLAIEDIRTYIHGKIEEVSPHRLSILWTNELGEDDDIPKPEYKTLSEKTLDVWHKFLNFENQEKYIRMVLSRIHDQSNMD